MKVQKNSSKMIQLSHFVSSDDTDDDGDDLPDEEEDADTDNDDDGIDDAVDEDDDNDGIIDVGESSCSAPSKVSIIVDS